MESRNTFKSQFERLRNKEKTLRARVAAMEYYLDEEDRESYFRQALLIEECAEQLMITAVRNANTLTIDGTIYDDFYVGS